MNKEKLVELMETMSLEEKIGQMEQLSGEYFNSNNVKITGPKSYSEIAPTDLSNVGSVLGVDGANNVDEIQRKHIENNSHGIPLLFMADVVHGYQTIFPIPLGIGATWNTTLAEKAASVAAAEASREGIKVTFAPMVDLTKDPRWGRVMESTGEDYYLNGEFSSSFTKGFQGKNPIIGETNIVACVKHFAAYGDAQAGRDYNSVDISSETLRQEYFPGYIKAFDAGAKMVMASFNTINGIPSTSNKWLLRDYLRDELGFKGVVISDWSGVTELVAHGVAKNEKEAAKLAITAGIDIEMATHCYHKYLGELVTEGSIPIRLIDEACFRVLTLKNDLGLFEEPMITRKEKWKKTDILLDSAKDISLDVAKESLVLLKNKQHILPLKESDYCAFIGPFVCSSDLLGAWSWKGDNSKTETIASILTKYYNVNRKDIFDTELNIEDIELKKIVDIIIERNYDKIIFLIGESSGMSGEASSRSEIGIPSDQIKLIRQIERLKIPIISVVFCGRPLTLSEVNEISASLLVAWHPGTMGALAVSETLFGDVNPSGKLPMTFPRNVGQVPIYYNHLSTGRPVNKNNVEDKYLSKYLDIDNTPLYPFGYGESYSKFDFKDLTIPKNKLLAVSDSVKAFVKVTNTSMIDGDEVIQWYIRDVVGELSRPVKQLVSFEKKHLKSKESYIARVEINLDKLEYIHSDLKRKMDSGDFILYVGGNSRDVLYSEFLIE